MNRKSYYIFHDLRLQDQSRFFQLDTLLISKKYALIIEVKNIAGAIYFDPHFNQLIRTIEGKRNGLSRSHHASQPPGITIDQLVLEKQFSLTAHPFIDCHQ
ncbi:nuclease-related domain-containing protein [Peribacillus frigoritolerans]|nr:nuclease-related domain-containing protein [Peribacillus frigoritolerans]